KPAEVLGVEEICTNFGISHPEQLIDLLGLMGDASDNIPGIPGVGPKTARKLLEEFGSVENIIEQSDKIKNVKLRDKVQQNVALALECKMLATIILDVPVEYNREALKYTEPNIPALKALFEELEFRNFANRFFTQYSLNAPQTGVQGDLFTQVAESEMEDTQISNIENTPHNYKLIATKEERKALIEQILSSKSYCFDTETTGLDVLTADLVGMSFAIKETVAYYVSLPEDFQECKSIVDEFRIIFEHGEIEKIGQNLKFDISILKRYDVKVCGPFFDTMLAHYLIEPDQRHNMDDLALTYLKYKTVSIESLIGKKGKNQLNMRQVPIDQIKEYAAEDADITLKLRNIFKPLLEETGVDHLFEEIELPLISVLASMEHEGVKLDIEALKEFSILLASEISTIEQNIYDHAEMQFNISSPKQLGDVLFEKLKISEKPKKTKTGQYSTGEEILVKLIKKHPIIQEILEYRSLTKLKSTYVDALPLLVNPVNSHIHTSYNQAVAATGRLSSNNPNLQNIPIRTEKGREIRKAFVPRDENHVLIAADYSQIELRIMATLSQDENMLDAFSKGIDIHTATASRIYGVTIEEVTKDMRRNAKTANFGIIYGISAFGLAERLDISRKESSELIKNYFEKYPRIKAYMDESIAFAREHGYVETIKKRRRYLRDINSANSIVRGFAERNAINAPIQGSSADMIKIAMINIYNELQNRGFKSKMILQVHDELVFDAQKEEVEDLKKMVEHQMKNAIVLDIPLEVDINTGLNWLEAH
ncbi:MAG: DNA polymerase I, partial [Bacteroidales bacterium]|nr:DNA polymerase I [Bacteroidales bacterium]